MIAWTRFMTRKYPMDVVGTTKSAYKLAGAAGAFAGADT